MDRTTIYYGQLPRETDLLSAQQSAMVAVAKMAEAILGTNVAVDGFTVTPTIPASLNVILTAGQIFQLENLEATTWSSLSSDTSHSVVKQGIQIDPVTFGITPPGTVGYSQVFLVQVQYQDLDTGSTVLPYYNASNPSQPYSGPGNNGSAQNTVRKGAVSAQVKAGTAAATGSQVAPAPDAGFTGLFTITVANGATSISSGNIAQYSGAPFIPVKLPNVPAGVQSGKWEYGVDTGTANAMVVALNPAPTSLVPGMTVRVKKGPNANTGATTLDIGLGANNVARCNGSALQSGDIPANSTCEYTWDGSVWQMPNFQGLNAGTTNNNTYVLSIPYAADSGTKNNVVASFTPAITSRAAGDVIEVKIGNQSDGPCNIVVNALASAPIIREDGGNISSELHVGMIALLKFDGTNYQLAGTNAQGLSHGRCYFSLSGGNVVLAPYNGNGIIINNALRAIPQAGVSASPSGLTPLTVYYVYAYMSGANIALEFSTTGHSTAANGVETKTGDTTRTLVGMVMPIAGQVFADSAGQRYVLSWFNRKEKASATTFTQARDTASGTLVELNSEIRNGFLSWADETVAYSATGSVASTIEDNPGAFVSGIGFDGTTPESGTTAGENPTVSYIVFPLNLNGRKSGLAENAVHYATLLGASVAGTSRWYADTNIQNVTGGIRAACVLNVAVRG